MTTTTVKTIGTGGDYTTLQAWEDASPANLVSSDVVYQGQCKAQDFSGGSTMLTISGQTTDATRYMELTTEAGASFSDNANVRTNALRLNTANGTCITCTNGYSGSETLIVVTNNTRVNKLQIRNTGSNGSGTTVVSQGSSILYDKCIFSRSSSGGQVLKNTSSAPVVANCLIHANNGANGVNEQHTLRNCTIIGSGGNAFSGNYAVTIQNGAIFGFTNLTTGSGSRTYTTCYSDKTGTGITQVNYDTSTGSGFENISSSTWDWRLKSTSAMLDVGTTDTTYAAKDISNLARPSGAAYDVGCWEYAAAAATYGPPHIYTVKQAPRRARSW